MPLLPAKYSLSCMTSTATMVSRHSRRRPTKRHRRTRLIATAAIRIAIGRQPASSDRNLLAVKLRLEADQQFAAAEIEHRPLDHGRLSQHQRDGPLLVDPGLVLVRQLAKRHAGPVEQRLPTDFLAPALQPLALDARGL